MGLSLWIAPESQYGVLRLQDGRPGARRHALVEGIQRSLFLMHDGPGNETQGGPDFALALKIFSKSAGQIQFPQPATRKLWDKLTEPPRDITHGPAGPCFDAVFCMAVHGLCRALAVHPLLVDALDPGEEEPETGDLVEGNDAGFVPEGADPGLWAAESWCQGSVADLLVKSLPRGLREAEQANLSTSVRLIAAALLDCLIAALRGWFKRRQDQPGQPHYIVARTPRLARRVASLLAALPYFFTPQPLKDPVAYRLVDAGLADTDDRDYFRVDLIGYRRTNRFLDHFHASAVDPDRVAPEFQNYLDAVNAQQAVAWRINLPLHAMALRLVGIAADPEVREAEAQQAGLTAAATGKLRDWIVEAFYRPKRDSRARRTYQRPGEILDHPLMRSALAELCDTGADGRQARFFLPWKADYRGRIYAETPWLTPQGGDLQRALFEFAEGSPLDAGGVTALRRHGANLVKRGRILDDLGIVGRQVLTLEERERWVQQHEADILASADSPIAVSFWREVAVKPMQFLAFCLAYRQWHLTPEAPVHLPVQIDGTCNGLQHIAMLTGDTHLAQAVNVLPRGDGVPGDVYSEVAVAARQTLGHIGSLLSPNTKHPEGLRMADDWLAGAPATWLDRGAAKKVIMTVPYGARENSQAEHVAEAIAGRVEKALRDDPNPPQVADLCAWVAADPDRGRGLSPLTKGQFRDLRKQAFAKDPGAAQAKAELQRLEIVTAYAARVIVKHLRHALATAFPCVDRFSDWLRQKAHACAGLPLLWPTPLGFPVCQDKFELEGGSATAKLGGRRTIRVDVERLGHRVEVHKQRDALLPNLIHNLDATHLALVLNAAQDCARHGVGSIHDCLLCHPNDAAGLSWAVRRTFARLYRTTHPDGMPDLLADWGDWMDGLARLRSLHNHQIVLGAIEHPGGAGERALAAQVHGGGETGQAAAEALALIASLRRLPPARQGLMLSLLKFLNLEAKKARAARLRAAGRADSAADLPIASGIPLGDGTVMSDYFFS